MLITNPLNHRPTILFDIKRTAFFPTWHVYEFHVTLGTNHYRSFNSTNGVATYKGDTCQVNAELSPLTSICWSGVKLHSFFFWS